MSRLRAPDATQTWVVSPVDLHAKLGRRYRKSQAGPNVFLRGYRVKLTRIVRQSQQVTGGVTLSEAILAAAQEFLKLHSMTDDQFKCLIFVCALQSPRDTENRTRLLNRIEQDRNINLRTLKDEFQRLENLKQDSAIVEQCGVAPSSSSVHAVTKPRSMSTRKQQEAATRRPLQYVENALCSLLSLQETLVSKVPRRRPLVHQTPPYVKGDFTNQDDSDHRRPSFNPKFNRSCLQWNLK
ncbi:unnamed protein product [Echinostoma caproni]|uniref:TFIIB domain-containing protein n=1 Tax=Echinostoma caproni TaxID=27848 RepID=A0A183ABG6_9TREM|nr:unnamed protein product [Echinostoma caproni]